MNLRIIYKYDDELIGIGEHPMCGNTIPALLKLHDILSDSRASFKHEALGDLIEIYLNIPFVGIDEDLIKQLTTTIHRNVIREILKKKTVIKGAGKLFKPSTSELYSGYTHISVDLHSLMIDISGILSKVPIDLMQSIKIDSIVYDADEEFHGPIFKFDELDTYIKILDNMDRKLFRYNDEVMMTYTSF